MNRLVNLINDFLLIALSAVIELILLQDIIKIDRNKRYSQDRLVGLKQEESNLKMTITKEEQYIDKMKSVLEIVQKLTDPSQGLSLGQVAHLFTHLQVT